MEDGEEKIANLGFQMCATLFYRYWMYFLYFLFFQCIWQYGMTILPFLFNFCTTLDTLGVACCLAAAGRLAVAALVRQACMQAAAAWAGRQAGRPPSSSPGRNARMPGTAASSRVRGRPLFDNLLWLRHSAAHVEPLLLRLEQ